MDLIENKINYLKKNTCLLITCKLLQLPVYVYYRRRFFIFAINDNTTLFVGFLDYSIFFKLRKNKIKLHSSNSYLFTKPLRSKYFFSC